MPDAEAIARARARHTQACFDYNGQDVQIDGEIKERGAVYAAPQFRPDLMKLTGLKTGMIATVHLKKADWPALPTVESWKEKTLQIRVGNVWQKLTVRGINSSDPSGEWILYCENIP